MNMTVSVDLNFFYIRSMARMIGFGFLVTLNIVWPPTFCQFLGSFFLLHAGLAKQTEIKHKSSWRRGGCWVIFCINKYFSGLIKCQFIVVPLNCNRRVINCVTITDCCAIQFAVLFRWISWSFRFNCCSFCRALFARELSSIVVSRLFKY